MYLFELFNAPLDWEIDKDSATRTVATFTVNEMEYSVILEMNEGYRMELGGPFEEFRNIFDVNFHVDYFDHKAGQRKGGIDNIIGTGNAIKVFTTVVDIIETIVEKKNIQHLFFYADTNEPSRVKLYNRMVKTLVKDGWRYISDNEINARSTYEGDDSGDIGIPFQGYFLTRQPHPHEKLL